MTIPTLLFYGGNAVVPRSCGAAAQEAKQSKEEVPFPPKINWPGNGGVGKSLNKKYPR